MAQRASGSSSPAQPSPGLFCSVLDGTITVQTVRCTKHWKADSERRIKRYQDPSSALGCLDRLNIRGVANCWTPWFLWDSTNREPLTTWVLCTVLSWSCVSPNGIHASSCDVQDTGYRIQDTALFCTVDLPSRAGRMQRAPLCVLRGCAVATSS